jgi:hypothetical protein
MPKEWASILVGKLFEMDVADVIANKYGGLLRSPGWISHVPAVRNISRGLNASDGGARLLEKAPSETAHGERTIDVSIGP